jgi:hypothetical protein
MNVIQIVENLYVNKKPDWIEDLEEADIQPYIIQRFLAMNDSIRVQTRWLDKYVYVLTPKMYLSLAWSVIPKFNKQPFVKYIKQTNEEEELAFILTKIRKQFKLSDNDYKAMKSRIIKAIKSNMPEWFKYYGIDRKYWKQYYLNFDFIKEEEKPKTEKISNLASWGL